MVDLIDREYDKALDAVAEGNTAAVELCCRRLMRAAPDDPRTLEIRAERALLLRKYPDAELLFRQLTEMGDPDVALIGFGRLGDLAAIQGEFASAIRLHRRVAALARKGGQIPPLLNSLRQIALLQLELGQLEKSSSMYSRLRRQIARLIDSEVGDYTEEYATACQEQADVLRRIGRLQQSRELLQESIDGFTTLGNPIAVAMSLCSLGVVHQILGNYDEAEQFHRESISTLKHEGWDEGLSMNYGNMAMLNIHRRNFEEAERWAVLAYRIDRREHDQTGRIHYYLLMTEIEFERGQSAKAEVYGKKCLKLAERHGDPEDIASAQSKLGMVYRELGQFVQSEDYTTKSLQTMREMQHGDGIAAQTFELAELRKAQGRFAESRSLGEDALALYTDLNSRRMIRDVTQFLDSLEGR